MLKSVITGETFVNAFENEYGKRYSMTISKKNPDGNWENGYINAQFKKGVDLASGSKINIKNGWLSCYKSKDNKYVPFVFVNDFELLGTGNTKTTTSAGFMQVEDNSLPF